MRRCFVLLLYLTLCFANSKGQLRRNIVINGVVRGMDIQDGKAFIAPLSFSWDANGYSFDSLMVTVKNNRFSFRGFMPYPHGFETIYFIVGKYHYPIAPFFLDSGNIEMVCYVDSVKKNKPFIRGSKTNEEFNKQFLKDLRTATAYYDKYQNNRIRYYEIYGNMVPDTLKQANQLLYQKFINEKFKVIEQYIKKHPKSYIPLAYVGQLLDKAVYDLKRTEKIFYSLSRSLQNTSSGVKIKSALQVKNWGRLSDTLLSLKFVSSRSQTDSIKPQSKQFTLVDFWFSTCPPCVRQFPELKALYNEFGQRGFEIVSINTDKTMDEWINSSNKYNLPWSNFWDSCNQTPEKLLIASFPTNYLIDNNGKIVAQNISIDELRKYLAKMLL